MSDENGRMHGGVAIGFPGAPGTHVGDPAQPGRDLAGGGICQRQHSCRGAFPAGIGEVAAERERLFLIGPDRQGIALETHVHLAEHGERPGAERRPAKVADNGQAVGEPAACLVQEVRQQEPACPEAERPRLAPGIAGEPRVVEGLATVAKPFLDSSAVGRTQADDDMDSGREFGGIPGAL